jgi:hypothetical protein
MFYMSEIMALTCLKIFGIFGAVVFAVVCALALLAVVDILRRR